MTDQSEVDVIKRLVFCTVLPLLVMQLLAVPMFASTVSDNAQITSIFQADKDDRAALQHGATKEADWDRLAERDSEREKAVANLIKAGALHSAVDYRHAAVIYQHSDKLSDYLLAHCLAMIAVSLGDAEARWLEAATLDRYLQEVGQPQVFGTQFSISPAKSATQAPYDTKLLSDHERSLFKVPSRKDQETKRKAMQAY